MQEGLKKLDGVLTEYLVKKVPGLPLSVKEFLVNFGPWISLVLGIMLVPAVLAVLRFGFNYWWGVLAVGQVGLQFAAVPGLMKRQLSGWRLAFYGTLVGGIYSLVSFNLIGLIVGTGLGLYFLYQIKSYYK